MDTHPAPDYKKTTKKQMYEKYMKIKELLDNIEEIERSTGSYEDACILDSNEWAMFWVQEDRHQDELNRQQEIIDEYEKENKSQKERIAMLEKYCDVKDASIRNSNVESAGWRKKFETSQHQYRWLKESFDRVEKENIQLKQQIDKQHEELQEIKNKLKDILNQ